MHFDGFITNDNATLNIETETWLHLKKEHNFHWLQNLDFSSAEQCGDTSGHQGSAALTLTSQRQNLSFHTALLTVTDGTALLADYLYGSYHKPVRWLAGWNSLQEHTHSHHYIFSFTTFNFLFCHFLYFYITSSKTALLLNWLHAITTIITSMRNSDIVGNVV